MIANRTATTAPTPVRKAILRASASFRAWSSSRSRRLCSLFGFCARGLLACAAAGEVGAVGHIKSGGDVGAAVARERLGKALALMREPGVAARVCIPVARRSLDALQSRQKAEILGQPAVEQAPLPQQRFMSWLDRRFPGLVSGLRIA
jgi:hypothetical protein